MLRRLEKFLNKHPQAKDKMPSEKSAEKVMLATTALFLEMVYADFKIDPQEEKEIVSALKTIFNIRDQEIVLLIEEAKAERASKYDIWGFTNIIINNFSQEERINILEKLWLLVFADGRVDKYEDALIRKISGLLGLEHSDMIQTKLRIRKQLEQQA